MAVRGIRPPLAAARFRGEQHEVVWFWEEGSEAASQGTSLVPTHLLRQGGWLASLGMLLGGGLAGGARAATDEGSTFSDSIGAFFQKQYQEMTRQEIEEAIGRIERKAKRRYDVDIKVGDAPPPPGVVFGFALNLSRCTGVRECVEACVQENNLSRSPQVQYIRVVELQKGSLDLHESNHYYDTEKVPCPTRSTCPCNVSSAIIPLA